MTFAYYRFPNERVYTAIRQFDDNVERLSSFEDLNGKEGFVMAPFRISESTPLLLIRPDTIVRKPVQCDVDFEESAFSVMMSVMNMKCTDVYLHFFMKTC